jgi:hypothetical protein
MSETSCPRCGLGAWTRTCLACGTKRPMTPTLIDFASIGVGVPFFMRPKGSDEVWRPNIRQYGGVFLPECRGPIDPAAWEFCRAEQQPGEQAERISALEQQRFELNEKLESSDALLRQSEAALTTLRAELDDCREFIRSTASEASVADAQRLLVDVDPRIGLAIGRIVEALSLERARLRAGIATLEQDMRATAINDYMVDVWADRLAALRTGGQ